MTRTEIVTEIDGVWHVWMKNNCICPKHNRLRSSIKRLSEYVSKASNLL